MKLVRTQFSLVHIAKDIFSSFCITDYQRLATHKTIFILNTAWRNKSAHEQVTPSNWVFSCIFPSIIRCNSPHFPPHIMFPKYFPFFNWCWGVQHFSLSCSRFLHYSSSRFIIRVIGDDKGTSIFQTISFSFS